jgi:uridine phosphorylase
VTAHLHPTAPIAADALLPGDPGRALALAQALLSEPKMANHNRGLWGYSGTTPAGHHLTIQSTGIGGPSGAIVLEELATLGVRRAVRVGTCVALDGRLGLGDVVLVAEAIADDGASRALGANSASGPDPALHDGLRRVNAAAQEAIVASTDLFYDPEGERRRDAWLAAGASAVELGTAALFEVGRRRGVAVASCLVVAEQGGAQLDADDLSAAATVAGRLCAEALGA